MPTEPNNSVMPDAYDRLLGSLDGLPDVVATRPATVRTATPLLGKASTYIVQTFRQRDTGDTIFLEVVSGDGSLRIALPPKVAATISRQRETLTAKARSKAAKAAQLTREERGIVPFQKKTALGRED